jgi:hypothetical protein
MTSDFQGLQSLRLGSVPSRNRNYFEEVAHFFNVYLFVPISLPNSVIIKFILSTQERVSLLAYPQLQYIRDDEQE